MHNARLNGISPAFSSETNISFRIKNQIASITNVEDPVYFQVISLFMPLGHCPENGHRKHSIEKYWRHKWLL